MATKAQMEKSLQQRSKPKRAPAKKRPRRDVPVDTSEPGKSATDRRAGIGNTAARNYDLRAGRKAAVMLEDSATTPSRKSTRRSANRIKGATPLTAETKRRVRSPKATAASVRAKAVTVRGKGGRGGA